MTEKILFFFSALGIFNAALLAIYLVAFKRNKQLADFYLAALVFLVVIRVGVSCFQYFGQLPFEIIKLGLIANLLMGPAVFFLMKALIQSDKPLIRHSLWHLGAWALGLGITWFSFDTYTWDWRVRFVIHTGLAVYLVATAIQNRKVLGSFLRSKAMAEPARKAAIIYLSLLLICTGFAVSLFTNYILGPLVFSLIFYWALGFYFLSHRQQKKQGSVKKIAEPEFEKLNQRLTRLMEEERLYRNPDLNLEQLASQLSVSRHLLSQLLNDNLSKNFHQYINDYRIQEACDLLKENNHFSIEAIGSEVGFHSRSSFFSSFKRLMGMTPSAYRKQAAAV